MTYRSRLFLGSLFLFLFPLISMAQYGPMGIGNKDGTPTAAGPQPRLLLWLDGSSSAQQTNNGPVTTWNDKSGNGHNFTASGNNRPTFLSSGGPSGTPCLSFDGNDDRLICSNFELPGNGYSIYFVIKTNDDNYGLFSYATPTEPYEVVIYNNSGIHQRMLDTYDEARTTIGDLSDGTWNYGGLLWDNTTDYLWQYNQDTHNENNENTFANGITITDNGTAVIGDIQTTFGGGFTSPNAFDGQIAEIIVFEGFLPKAQTRLMRTYLWTKYGEDFDNGNYGWDKFHGFSSGSGGQYYEPIGVGKDSGGDTGGAQTESHAQGLVLRVNNGEWNTNMKYLCAAPANSGTNQIVSSSLPASVQQRWSRVWEIAGKFADGQQFRVGFDFGEGINGDFPQNVDNYVLLWRNSPTSGAFQIFNESDIAEKSIVDDEVVFRINANKITTANRYYTIGTKNPGQSSLDGTETRTWYAYQSGNWDNPTTWTLDGSAAPTYVNPESDYPSTGDNIYIGTGRTVSVNINSISQGFLKVFGTLDVGSQPAPSFSNISGSGLISCSGNGSSGNFPTGNSTAFADPVNGGTAEFYGSGGFTQSSNLEVNKLKVNLSSTSATMTLAADLTHNGLFEVNQGTFVVNDNSNNSRTITSNARVLVESPGKIKVSTSTLANKHKWYFYKDLINNGGEVKFTNRTVYSDYNYTNDENQDIVEAYFSSSSNNQELRANGSTYFSRIVIDKGVDKTYILSINSTDSNYFKLLGSCNNSNMGQQDYYDASGNKEAFALINGTAEIKENIFIPLQTNSGNYNINYTAQLWVNGGEVTKGPPVGTATVSEAIVNYGLIKVSSGTLNANCRSGITTRGNGVTQIDGGEIHANQIRTSVYGPSNIGGIIINGGDVYVDGNQPGSTNGSYYTFSLTYPGNLFRMTGGKLHVTGPSSAGLIFINSNPENTNVTGGEVIVDISDTDNHYYLSSRAAFWDLTVKRSNTSTNRHLKVIGGNSGVTGAVATIGYEDLVIRNNLNITGPNNPTLEMGTSSNPADLFLYGDLSIDNGCVYLHNNNNTHFVGSSNSSLTFGGSTTFPFYNVEVNKNFNDRKVKIQNSGADPVMDIKGSLFLEKGYFDNGRKNVELKGSITNRTQFGDVGSSGYLRMNGNSGRQDIISAGGVFYRLVLDNSSGVALENDGVSIRDSLYLDSGSFFIGDNKLRIESTDTNPVLNTNSTDRFVVCSGNASAGGIELLNHESGQHLVYPFGVSTGSGQKYTPADIYINTGWVDDGYIRITPVDTLPSTSNLSGTGDYLNYYWKVTSSDYTTKPKVTHVFTYNEGDVRNSDASFESGRILSELPFSRSVDNAPASAHVNTGSNLIYYNGTDQAQGTTGTGTALVNADYSAGAADRFTGSPQVFFTRNSIDIGATWETPGNWNKLSDCTGCTDVYDYHSTLSPASTTDYPEAGDVAIIGFDVNSGTLKPHVYKAPTGGIQAAQVLFTPLQDAGWNLQPRYNGSGSGNLGILRPTLQITQTSDIIKVGQISGEGELMLSGDVDLGVSDIGGFLSEDSSIVVINNGNLTPVTSNFLPAVLPNLFLAYTNTTITSDLLIRGNLEVAGLSRLYLSESLNGNIEIDGDLILDKYQSTSSQAQVLFNKRGTLKTIDVHGDLKLLGTNANIGINPNPGAPVVPVPWTPDEVGALLWFDAQDTTKVLPGTPGSKVTAWNNKGSAPYNSVQSDTDKQPIYSLNALNGHPTIHFDGNDDFLTIANHTDLDITANQDFELFSVVKSDVNPDKAAVIAKGGVDPGDYMLYFYTPKYKFYMDHNAISMEASGGVGTNANMGWARRQGNSGELYNTISGTASDNGVSGASTFGNPHDVTIGAMDNGTARFFDGDIAEIILIKHALTNEDRQRMEGYLAHKWGLAGDLPAGHPYKADAPLIGGNGNQPAQLIVDGNIIQNLSNTGTTNNGLDLYKITPANLPLIEGDTAFVNLIVSSVGTNEFDNASGPTPRLWKLTVDKGTDISSSFTFNTDVNIAGPADEPEKPVNIQNGLLKFNDPAIDITLSSGGGDFLIPGTGGLELDAGNFKINGSETGLLLTGSLKIDGGNLTIGNIDGENNYIEYAASGSPKLTVSGGVLSVGSQIRRGLSSLGGALQYRQSGGDVIVGKYSAPATNRGMLEVLNSGSRFDHTGGTLTFVRGVNLGSTPSLLLTPSTSNVGGTSEIIIGNGDSPSGAAIENFGINSAVALNALTINTTHSPAVHLITNDLELNGDLNIQTGATLNCNDRNLLLNKDVTNDGLLSSTSGKVSLIHPGTGAVDGSGVFDLYDLERSGGSGGNTQVSVDLLVKNDFTNDDGEMDFGSHTLTVKGNVSTDGNLVFASGEGLIMSGTDAQILRRSSSGTSAIDVLTINNSSGVSIPASSSSQFVINKNLRLEGGIFNLQGNLLELGLNADIEEVNPFGETNMISTGGAFTNFGVRKYIPANSTNSVFLPLGINKFMPVNLDFSQDGFSSGSTNSSYLIKLIGSTNTGASIHPDSVLAMFFTVDAANVGNNLTMNMQFHYDDSYVNPDLNTEPLYSAIWIHANNTTISKLGTSLVDENANTITFSHTGDFAGSEEALDGDYFAGLESALPDNIPIFQTVQNGDVNDGCNEYDVHVTGCGAPSGALVRVRGSDVLTFNIDNVNFYRTEIDPDATVKIDATSFHRLGRVSGTGTIHLVGTGTLPAGDYTNFFDCFGGKLIYEGTSGDNFEILANTPPIEKVDVIGSSNSDITIANNDVNICTDLTIDGPRVKAANSSTLTVSENLNIPAGELNLRQGNLTVEGNLHTSGGAGGGAVLAGNMGKTSINGNLILDGGSFGLGTVGRETHLKGNLSRTSGTITQGTGGAKLVFDGSTQQTVSGNFTVSNSAKIPFIEMNNAAGLTLNGDVDVSDTLKLTKGNIFTNAGNILKLTEDGTDVDPEGGSAASFVDGPMQWTMNNSSDERTFPVGKNDRYRPLALGSRSGTGVDRTWEVEYYDTLGLVQTPVTSMDPDPTNVPAIESVSIQEHWRVNSNTGSSTIAKVRLSWGDNSAVSTEQSDQSNLVVLGYNTATDVWDSYGGDGSSFNYNASTNQGDFLSDDPVPFTERYLTLGSSDALNPLPVTWLYFKGETDGENHTLTWATASEQDNDYFELERSIDAQSWTAIGQVTGAGHSTSTRTYSYVDRNAPYGRVYYRLKQVDFDAKEDYAPNIVSLERVFEPKTDTFDFLLYPNPTSNRPVRFRMSNVSDAVARVMISDLSGKVIRQDYVQIDGQGASAPMVCDFDPGIYLVTVFVNQKMKSKPLVIVR